MKKKKKWEYILKTAPFLAMMYGSISTLDLVAADPYVLDTHFTSNSAATAVLLSGSPPNPNGWVGESQYVLMTYSALRSFNKTTFEPDGVLNTTASSFFGFPAQDVRIDYSRFAQRWCMTCQQQDPVTGAFSNLVLTASSEATITPSTKWSTYKIPISKLGTNLTSLDYNQSGTDCNAVYLCVRIFNSNSNPELIGSSCVVFQNSSLIAGDPVITIFPAIGNANPVLAASTPADNYDPDAKFGYITAGYYSNSFPGPEGNQIAFYRIVNPSSTTPSLSPPEGDPTYPTGYLVTVPNFVWGQDAGGASPSTFFPPHKGNLYSSGGNPPGALQYDISSNLSATHVRNKQLYMCQPTLITQNGTVNTMTGDRFGIAWYQFDLTGDLTGMGSREETATTIPVLVRTGVLYDSVNPTDTAISYYTPSITTNSNSDIVLNFTMSSSTTYTNLGYATINAGMTTTPNPIVNVTNNTTNPYNFGGLNNPNDSLGQRWGDESSACPDPTADTNVWLTGMWAALYNAWGVETVVLKPAP